MISSFRDLKMWQQATDLAVEIYVVTKRLPKEEVFGLSSQMRRAVISIASNIAEGSKRKTSKDFAHFLNIANGSAAELETQLHIVTRVYPTVKTAGAVQHLESVQKMLGAYIRKIYSS